MTAIYARQSIDKKDSISIDTQIDFCKRFVCAEQEYRIYTDKGWSGKNIERPEFQRLLSDIKRGTITKLIVYKLDRISRSLHDFSNLMELFRQYNVEFASTVETFDTSTAIGRAMLGIIMVFAELERENILMRVKDNYYARGEKGLYLGGPPTFGFDKTPTTLGGIKTSVLMPNTDMTTVQFMYDAYREERTSLGDIAKQLNADGILSPNGSLWDSNMISRILRNPSYVMADTDVYHYYKEKGCKIPTPVEEFTGEHGCFLYGKRTTNERKYTDVKDHVLTIGLHDGVIPAQVWLDVQHKLDGNKQLKKGKQGTRSWLTGLIKCGSCGYALRVINKDYFYCSGKANKGVCGGFSGNPKIDDVEQAVREQLFQKFEEIRDISIESDKPVQSPAVNKLKMRLENVSSQIENLVDKIAATSSAIGKVLEDKLEALIKERGEIEAEINKHSAGAPQRLTYKDVLPLLSEFDAMPVESRNAIAKQFIHKILLWDDKIEIVWRF